MGRCAELLPVGSNVIYSLACHTSLKCICKRALSGCKPNNFLVDAFSSFFSFSFFFSYYLFEF